MDDYAHAGKRLHRDADYLYDQQRYATASHLYGLSAECSIKAFITQQPGQQKVPYKHIPELVDDAKRLVNGRRGSHLLNVISSPDFMSGWQIGNRYWDNRYFSQQQCKEFKHSANRALRCLGVV
ncbi:hypothetical protein SAMN04488490_0087 [Marinobacter sp. LV10R510-11A]|uniref:hypothetical protein n=1 Tax=Marinobacter sp. LV10R510-11A TaxID=1415568 RepID=UPI000BB876AD|nr:hypothetical protein [Marinobacter sp. LV10R510-11A]SOB74599.1 hypothetical protein SAMN04488490_0087 [Marinobacter sp. LV10R510-11A]